MRLHEFEAKALFREHGIPAPEGEVAETAVAAARIAGALGGPVAVKAQVLVGGRGRAGGIRMADSPAEAGRVAEAILGTQIRGCLPEGVLVEEGLEIEQEIYLGITVDRAVGRPAVVVSSAGGVEIEETAAAQPETMALVHTHPNEGLSVREARDVVSDAGLENRPDVADVLCRLYELFLACEATIAEINPLVVTQDGGIVAADAVVEVDDAALFRHAEFRARARSGGRREAAAHKLGMTYVELDGEIGLITSGAGLGMATMDLIAEGSRPANFLETGGGITQEVMAEAMRIVLDRPRLKGVLINIYGGINPIHEGALGVAEVMAEGVSVPVVAKALGNFQEETWATLEAAGVRVVRGIETEEAVAEVLRRAQG